MLGVIGDFHIPGRGGKIPEEFIGILDKIIHGGLVDISDTYIITPNKEIYYDLWEHLKDICIKDSMRRLLKDS